MANKLPFPFVCTIHSEGLNPIEALAMVMERTGLKVDAIYITRNQVERIPEKEVGKETDDRS